MPGEGRPRILGTRRSSSLPFGRRLKTAASTYGVGAATGEVTTCGIGGALPTGDATGEAFAPTVGEGDAGGG